MILVLNLLATKRAGLSMDKNKDIALVATAMEILKVAESRYQPVGRLFDLLRGLWSFDRPLPTPYPPNNQNTFDAGASTGSGSLQSTIPAPFISDIPDEFYAQHGQFFESTSDHPSEPRSGMSGDQFFVDTYTPLATASMFEDELMSMWMAAPTDVANWDTYIENRNGPDLNWFTSFGAPQ